MFREGDVKVSPTGLYIWTCVIAKPDDHGRTVWLCTNKDGGDARYITVDWK